MTLRKILDDIALRMPHPFSEDEVVGFLNKTLLDISRCCARLDAKDFKTVGGMELYPLPDFIRPEGIKSVTVDDVAYSPALIEEGEGDRQYYFPVTGYMALLPTPRKTGLTIRIVFEDTGTLLTKSEIAELNPTLSEDEVTAEFEGQVPAIPDYYTELLELGVFVTIANATEDIDLANNYARLYNAKKSEATYAKYMMRGKYPVTKER